MRNNNYTRPPRKGVIVFASFVFAALFIIAFIISYEQRTDLAHSVHLSPISANYGMVSTVRSSSLAVPMHSTAPLLSSGTIHAYAYSGHATMPSTGSSSGFRIHTLSSATMHSYGSSGGGGGGGAVSGGSSSSPSSQTIRYNGVSVSMPSLAMTSTSRTNRIISSSAVLATETGNDSHRPGQIKRVHSDGFGGYEGDYNGKTYGLLTASEWNDLDNWKDWGEILTGEFYDKASYWEFYPHTLVAVQVVDESGTGLANVSVELLKNENVEFATRTDNKGFAYCWANLFDGYTEEVLKSEDFSLKVNGQRVL